jgi:hypothetical protein
VCQCLCHLTIQCSQNVVTLIYLYCMHFQYNKCPINIQWLWFDISQCLGEFMIINIIYAMCIDRISAFKNAFFIKCYSRYSFIVRHRMFFTPLRVRGYWSFKLEKQFDVYFLSKSFQWNNLNTSYNISHGFGAHIDMYSFST